MLDRQSGGLRTILRQSWQAGCVQVETEIETRTMAPRHGTALRAQFDKKLNLWQRGLRNEIATSQGKSLACDQTCAMRDKYSMRVLRYAGARARELGKDRKQFISRVVF